ncbi:MAG TPA: hypothetical protein PLI70_00085 [Gemmatimonadales bacterium]|nr:hypothetical protein [Gemmatimonadales bacterium]HRZ09102.1 hypothetical protein [Gemmatimonadales bacterium]
MTPAPSGRGLPIAGPAHPPPFWLTAEHFAAALLWLLAGAAGLVVSAGDLASGNFLAPRLLAVTHMFTLGVLTTTIFGALNQFFPGALGISIRSVRVAHWTWILHTAGTLTLVTGFWFWRPAMLGVGWLLLFAGVFGSSWNLLPQRRKAPRGLVVGRYVAAGHIALGTAMLVALARIGNSLGWWPLDRMAVVVSHFHLAVFGFVVFTAVGVGSWMLPMFLLAASAPTWPLRWIGPVGMSGLAILTAGALGAWPLLTRAGGTLVLASALLYLVQLGLYFRNAERRPMDPAMAHVAVGVMHFALAVVLGATILAGNTSVRSWLAYGLLAIVGWLTLLVVGVLYKIFPFLAWMNLFGPRAAQAGAPKQEDLTSTAMVRLSLALLTLGVWGLAGGVLAGHAPVILAGASLYLAGVLSVLGQYVRIVMLARPLPAQRTVTLSTK